MIAVAVTCALVLVSASEVPDRNAPPALPPAKSFVLPAPLEFQLKNGVRVWYQRRDRAPLVDVVASVEAGASADPPSCFGVSNWTAAMLSEGAGPLDALAFADAQAALGADITTSSGLDVANVALHVPASRFDEGVKLFASALMSPRVDDADWQRVKTNLMSDFVVQSQDPAALAAMASARVMWGEGHRFAALMQGTPLTLKDATRMDVVRFHEAHYRPDTTTLIVVGAVDQAQLMRVLEATFGAWKASGPRPATPTLSPPLVRSARAVVGVQIDGAPQTVLRVVNVAPAGTLPYTPDVEVMNTLLGGSFTSRLNDNLREQHGYSYGAGSRVVSTRHGTLFSVRTSVAQNVTVPAIGEIVRELERIAQPASADEVMRARNLVALGFPATFDSGRATCAQYGELVGAGIDRERVARFLKDVPKVDISAVQAAAVRIVQPNTSLVVAAGDVSALKAELTHFGAVTFLTAQDLLPGLPEGH